MADQPAVKLDGGDWQTINRPLAILRQVQQAQHPLPEQIEGKGWLARLWEGMWGNKAWCVRQ